MKLNENPLMGIRAIAYHIVGVQPPVTTGALGFLLPPVVDFSAAQMPAMNLASVTTVKSDSSIVENLLFHDSHHHRTL